MFIQNKIGFDFSFVKWSKKISKKVDPVVIIDRLHIRQYNKKRSLLS